jgi:hypothetical protein
MEKDIAHAYRDLERRMKARAEQDGDAYLPNPEPSSRVDYILVCMEPSLGHWAKSAQDARVRVAAGFRNFLVDIEPMLLHYSVRRFLCDIGQRYHITDFSKGAMPVKKAGAGRAGRYDKWYALLQEEIDLIAAPGARVIAVGKVVADHMSRRGFAREITSVVHYSPLAGRARVVGLDGYEDRFREFNRSMSLEAVLDVAKEVLDESGVPPEIHNEALTRVARSQLSESRRRLVFRYMLAFEKMKRRKI